MSRIQLLTSKISHICQEICDIKSARKPKSNLMQGTNTNTKKDEGQTDQNYTLELDNNSSANKGSDGEDGWDDTCSFHSKLCHHESNNLNNLSRHAPAPPSLNPAPSESILEPPGDLSPSPASKIVTVTPSLLSKLARKACSTALSSLVHTSPSGPCAAWNVHLPIQYGLGEESSEESGMMEESSSVTEERGGGPGVAGLRPEQGGGTGMAIDKEGGAEEDRTPSGRGSPFPLQVQQREL